ncbi:MAG TPA: hypothetical protein VND64_17000 [Pirellulales bacterium]|nr:hypothetical protein [Pirellulales bacterium]
MTRRSLNILSYEEQSLHQVWGWYEFQRALIGEEKSRVFDSLSSGTGLLTSRYLAKTWEELDDDFDYQTAELGRVTMLGVLTCTEAALRVDFIERVRNKKKDDISREFRKTHRRRGVQKVRLEEDILDVWRKRGEQAGLKSAVAELKGALNLRHWLAHGRYWKPKLGRAAGYDVVEVFDICNDLLQRVGLVLPDAPHS